MSQLTDTAQNLMRLLALPYPLDAKMDAYTESRTPEAKVDRIELDRLALQMSTTDMVEHSFDPLRAPGEWSTNDWVELARIPCENGKITTLRRVECGWYTEQMEYIRADQFEFGFGTFYLIYRKLNPGDRDFFSLGYPFVNASPPGSMLFQLPKWRDNRFAPKRNRQPLTIPLVPGYSLSLYVQIVGVLQRVQAWDANGVYQKGDLVKREVGGDIWCAKYDVEPTPTSQPPPGGTSDIWEPVYDVSILNWRIRPYGKLLASIQDEQHLTSAIQARETFHV